MSALLQLREVIDAGFDDDNYMTSDPASMATRMLEEARKIGQMALEMASEIATDTTITAGEAARRSALLSEETANAAGRLQSRLFLVRSMAFEG